MIGNTLIEIEKFKKLEFVLLEIDDIQNQINRAKISIRNPRGLKQALNIFEEVLNSYQRNRLELLYSIKNEGMELENDPRYSDEESKLELIDELNKYQKEIMPVLIKKLHPNK